MRQNKITSQEHDVVRFGYEALREWDADIDWYYFERAFEQLMSKHYYFRRQCNIGYHMNVERLIKLHLLQQFKLYEDPHMLKQAYLAWNCFDVHYIELWWDEPKLAQEIKLSGKLFSKIIYPL